MEDSSEPVVIKKKRGRPRKVVSETGDSSAEETQPTETSTLKKRGRPRKVISETGDSSVEKTQPTETSTSKKRGRTRSKLVVEPENEAADMMDELPESPPISQEETIASSAKTPKKRHRKLPDKTTWGRIVGNVSRDVMPGQRLPTNH